MDDNNKKTDGFGMSEFMENEAEFIPIGEEEMDQDADDKPIPEELPILPLRNIRFSLLW